MKRHPRRRQRDRGGQAADRRREARTPTAGRSRSRDLPAERAQARLRGLRGHRPRRRREPARDDARAAARGRASRPTARSWTRIPTPPSMDALGENDVRRDHHLDPPRDALRLAAPGPRRPPAQRAARPPGRARGGGPRRRARRRQAHPRGGQPDGRAASRCSSLLEAKAEEEPRRFIVIVPAAAARSRRRPDDAAERLAHMLKRARGRGARGGRPGGAPRPLHRDPERAPVLRARRHRHLDLPGDALGLAARRT